MSRFIETIQLLNGELLNLEFHQERFEQTRAEALGLKSHPQLGELIRVPRGLEKGQLKCRVSYQKEIELIEYEPHRTREVYSLKMVYSDTIDYGFKYRDRGELEKLFHQREACDDILVVKNGCVSDSFYANVVFWDGLAWVTPDTPLLPGTMRASLLAKGLIRESRITPENLYSYQKLKLINAMNDLSHAPEIPIESIL
jgi:4-amino-4-deoxychorismate lyase